MRLKTVHYIPRYYTKQAKYYATMHILSYTKLYSFNRTTSGILITPHAQHEWGKVIGVGVHMFVDKKN